MKKFIKKYMVWSALPFLAASCADDLTQEYPVYKPSDVEAMEIAMDYAPLKTYVNSNLKLGLAVKAEDYNKRQGNYVLANSNFTEITPVEGMAHGDCVSASGSLNFSALNNLVSSAKNEGVDVFGVALAWNINNNNDYLEESCFYEKVSTEVDPDAPGEVTEFVGNGNLNAGNTDGWSGNDKVAFDIKADPVDLVGNGGFDEALSGWSKGGSESIAIGTDPDDGTNKCLVVDCGTTAETDSWKKSIPYMLTSSMITSSRYTIRVKVKGSADLTDGIQITAVYSTSENKNEWGSSADVNYLSNKNVSKAWEELQWDYTANFPVDNINFLVGKNTGTMYFDDFSVEGIDNRIVYNCGDDVAQPSDKQAVYTFDKNKLRVNKEYTVKVKAKGNGHIQLVPANSSKADLVQDALDTKELSEDWAEYTWTFTAQNVYDQVKFLVGDCTGEVYFDDLSVKGEGPAAPPSATQWVNIVSNSDCEGDDSQNYVVRIKGNADGPATFADGGHEGKCIKIKVAAKESQAWDNQFFITLPAYKGKFDGQKKVKFRFWAKADAANKITLQTHVKPGEYKGGFGSDFTPTTEWKQYEMTSAIADGGHTITMNLNDGDGIANTYYFDDIEVLIEKPAGELPDDAKGKNLTEAMSKWVKDIMEATDGYVKAWNVVNQPLADNKVLNEDGYYPLHNEDEGLDGGFIWQRYMGDENYVRVAAKSARENFKGDASALKLFVNEKGLENYLDKKRLESLLYWIDRWEKDGVTKIDGIGAEMHVACYQNAVVKKTQEDAITDMFNKLKATGKLVRISGLDLSYVNENGETVKSSGMSAAQHKELADFYKFIINSYLTIIPAEQQYGITQWNAVDSDTANGLWDSQYVRKAEFTGFADGLSEK